MGYPWVPQCHKTIQLFLQVFLAEPMFVNHIGGFIQRMFGRLETFDFQAFPPSIFQELLLEEILQQLILSILHFPWDFIQKQVVQEDLFHQLYITFRSRPAIHCNYDWRFRLCPSQQESCQGCCIRSSCRITTTYRRHWSKKTSNWWLERSRVQMPSLELTAIAPGNSISPF